MGTINNGVYPTMVTPYKDNYEVDYEMVKKIAEYFVKSGVQGIFASCLSSEIFQLTFDERVKIARTVVEAVGDKIDVIAAGCISDDFDELINETRIMAKTGVKAVIQISNRFVGPDESDDVMIANLQRLVNEVPDVAFGLYECPHPYKRILTPKVLEWCKTTDRFVFIKDTSCNMASIKAKAEVLKGSNIKLFNANTATLLDSLKCGFVGFSGTMANLHPDLYVALFDAIKAEGMDCQKAQDIQAALTTLSFAGPINYPAGAKYHLMLEGVAKNFVSRELKDGPLTAAQQREFSHLHQLTNILRKLYVK